VAVLEIYSDVTELLGRIEDERWRTSITVVASLAVLYGFLFMIVRRAARMLQSKDRQLAQRLESVDQANQKLSRANAFLEHTVAMQDRELRGALSEAPIAQGGGANAPVWSRAERRAVE
jgi:C4-dicarboxylate-specific signal transduction histidine kinase